MVNTNQSVNLFTKTYCFWAIKSGLCIKLLPYLLHELLLCTSSPSAHRTVSEGLNSFFAAHYKDSRHPQGAASSRPSTPGSSTCQTVGENHQPAYLDRSSIHVMLDALQHLRYQPMIAGSSSKRRPAPKSAAPPVCCMTKWDQNFWVEKINYLHLAAAALTVGADYQALLYADVWCQSLRRGAKSTIDKLSSAHAADSLLNLVAAEEDGRVCQEIAYEACKRLGEREAMRGCGTEVLVGATGRMERLMEAGDFHKAMAVADASESGKIFQKGMRNE